MTEDEKLKLLQKSDEYILTDSGEVMEMPRKNKKCPCKSKKTYKNCSCYIKDLEKKTEYINRMTKKLEQDTRSQKGKSILLL